MAIAAVTREVGPGFDLYLGAGGERGDLHGRAGGAVVAERLGVHRVDRRRSRPMSVTNTVVLATSVIDAPQSARTAAMLASTWRACASTPPSTIVPVAGSRPTWPASTSQSPARTAGRVRAGHGRRARRGNGYDGHRYLLSRRAARVSTGRERIGPRRPPRGLSAFHAGGRDRGEHRVGRTGERLAVVVDDHDVDRRHVLGAHDAERADREVVHLAGRRDRP